MSKPNTSEKRAGEFTFPTLRIRKTPGTENKYDVLEGTITGEAKEEYVERAQPLSVAVERYDILFTQSRFIKGRTGEPR